MPAGSGERLRAIRYAKPPRLYLRFTFVSSRAVNTHIRPAFVCKVAWCRRGDDRDVSRSRNETGVDRRGRRSRSRLLRRSAPRLGARPAWPRLLPGATLGPAVPRRRRSSQVSERALALLGVQGCGSDCRQRSWGVEARIRKGLHLHASLARPWRHDTCAARRSMDHSASLPRCDAGGDPPERRVRSRSRGRRSRRRLAPHERGIRERIPPNARQSCPVSRGGRRYRLCFYRVTVPALQLAIRHRTPQ